MKDAKLIAGFGVSLALTIGIGIIGITQISALNKTIQELGRSHLRRETAILEMKINNALFAMGVRNYAFWRTSRYLETAAVGSDAGLIERSSANFKQQLLVYGSLAVSPQQRAWLQSAQDSARDLEETGKSLIRLFDSPTAENEKINKLFIDFENKFYKLDEFISETLSKNNLRDIEEQLRLTDKKKQSALILLLMSLSASVILGIMVAFVVYKSLRVERLHREILVQKMIRIEEEQRKNLSAQVHDQLSQDLSAMKIFLELIQKSVVREDSEQRERIDKCRKILGELIDKSHNISQMLRPPELDEVGLLASIDNLVAEYREVGGCNFKLRLPEQELKLTAEHSLLLYRLLQEGLTNISRHAQAKNVFINLKQEDNVIHLALTDDGLGFDYLAHLQDRRRRKEDKLKLGLLGLRERVELMNGTMRIESSVGKGVKIIVELPI